MSVGKTQNNEKGGIRMYTQKQRYGKIADMAIKEGKVEECRYNVMQEVILSQHLTLQRVVGDVEVFYIRKNGKIVYAFACDK